MQLQCRVVRRGQLRGKVLGMRQGALGTDFSVAVSEGTCGFCLMPLVDSFIRSSDCAEKFHPETLCMSVEEKVIFILLKDKVGTVNFCCCECRMVSGESRMGAVSNVSTGYAQLLRVVGCLINEVHSLKDCKMAACRDQGVTSDKQMGGLNRDVNFFRDAIFNEVREVNERKAQMFYNIKMML